MKLYEAIKQDIASGVYLSGSFLPNEFELSYKYNYSRGTVRSTLAMLEEDNLVELLKGKGRRICPVHVEKAKAPFTFLLPCADFISETFSNVTAQISRRILNGVSQVAFEHDYRVEVVPVSPTNYAHDINWGKLDSVNADSLLVVLGDWYRDLFPLLLERGCRVAFVFSHLSHRKEDEDFINRSFRIIINSFGVAETAVESLFRHGCRRIALFHRYILEPEHPTLSGYISGLSKCGLKFSAWHELPEEKMTLKKVKNQLRDFYKKSGGFDSLIITPELTSELCLRNLYQELELDENIKIIVSSDSNNNQLVTPSLTSMAFQYEEVGRIAAEILIAKDFVPVEKIINGRLIERESTLSSKCNFALTI